MPGFFFPEVIKGNLKKIILYYGRILSWTEAKLQKAIDKQTSSKSSYLWERITGCHTPPPRPGLSCCSNFSQDLILFFFKFYVSNKFCQDKIFLKVEKNYRLFPVGREYKHFISLEPPHRKFHHGNIFTACCQPFQNRGLKVATIICFSYSAGLFFFSRWIMQQAGNQVGSETFA